MLYLLLAPLRNYWILFNLFRYITFRAFLAGTFSIIFVLAFYPLFIGFLKKYGIGQRVRVDVLPHHRNKSGIPTMGGILTNLSIFLSLFLFADLSNRYIQLAILILFWLGILGFADDFIKVKKGKPKGLRKRTKFLFQFLLGLIVVLVLYFFPPSTLMRTKTNFLLFKNVIIDFGLFYIPFVVLFLVGITNAVNFADGLDGLSCGLCGITAGFYAVLCYVTGHAKIAGYLNLLHLGNAGEGAVLGLSVVGAALGFLWFNSYPAEIFLGDTGSLPLGGLLAFLAIVAKQEILFIFAGGVFILEVGSVVLQVLYFRLTRGKRIFLMTPLHHHFEKKNWPEPKIVQRFYIIAILSGFLALATLKIR
ncbi:MAG: phospho-N-acetylmuramoyl-pentapeptide-transferase [candidate division WOR-3 bacterium]